MSNKNLPDQWTREYLRDWVTSSKEASGYSPRRRDFYLKLADERRMADFWEWFRNAPVPPSMKNSATVANLIWSATFLPSKPRNMPPGRRRAYFKKVRDLAGQLRELLLETCFDKNRKPELDDPDLETQLEEAREIGREDEFAFFLSSEGPNRIHLVKNPSVNDIFDIGLTKILGDLISWTHFCELNATTFVQANAAHSIHFNYTVYDWFLAHGMKIPFPVLASIANVALDLGANETIDGNTVRKQVHRCQTRQAAVLAECLMAFGVESWTDLKHRMPSQSDLPRTDLREFGRLVSLAIRSNG